MTELPYKELLDNLYDGLYFVDTQRRITYWNAAAEKLTGYSAAEVLGCCCHDNLLCHVNERGENLCTGLCPLAKTIADGRQREADVFLRHKDGHRVPVQVRVAPVRDAAGAITGAVELFSNNTYRHLMRQRIRDLQHLSLIDQLTNIPNRRATEMHLHSWLDEFRRYQVPMGVLFCDIDNFKSINDTCGHEAGDLVLKTAAKTVVNALRPFDVVGRWGGEEFVCLIRNVTGELLHDIAERIRVLVAQSRVVPDQKELTFTVSIGATMARQDDTPDTVVKRADALMYAAKKQGRNRLCADFPHERHTA